MLPNSFILIIVLIFLTTSYSLNTTANTTGILDPKRNKKPTNKPVNKYPTKKPIYKYPSKKPVSSKSEKPIYKYPTKKPIYKYPTKKPFYKYPTKKPTDVPSVRPSSEPSQGPTSSPSQEPTSSPSQEPTSSPSQEPTLNPTVNPSIEPTFEPSSVPISSCLLNCLEAGSCSCDKYSSSGLNNVILCYSNAQPDEYLGVYDVAETPLFQTNLILPNPNFPSPVNFPSGSGSCEVGTYTNTQPLDKSGTGYLINSDYHVMFNNDGIGNINCNNADASTAMVALGSVDCSGNLLVGVGSLQDMPDTELSNDSKVTIAITVSIILTVFCVVAMLILYRKYNNKNAKENKDDNGLENFYITSGINNNYSSNPMENAISSEHDNYD